MIINKIKEEVEKKIPNSKIILITEVGSHLYGTNTENSDRDYSGIFIAPIEYYLGLKKIEEIDLSIKSKLPNGKNSKDAIDIKLYEFSKFLKLSMENNPNITELLFVKNEALFYTSEMEQIFNNTEMFISKKLFSRFMGYAISQEKKALIKYENLKKLIELKKILEKIENKNKLIVEIELDNKFLDKNGNINVSNFIWTKNLMVKRVLKDINKKLENSSYRKNLWEQFGYDTKFFSHLFRLLYEGIELATEKKITFPLKEKEFLKHIRNGKYTLEELQIKVKDLKEKFREIEKNTNLPKEPNFNKIETLKINILKDFLCNQH